MAAFLNWWVATREWVTGLFSLGQALVGSFPILKYTCIYTGSQEFGLTQ